MMLPPRGAPPPEDAPSQEEMDRLLKTAKFVVDNMRKNGHPNPNKTLSDLQAR
jgi:hypothetical protein